MRALDSTCEYIEKNMINVPLFSTGNEAIDFALNAVKTAGLYCEFGVFSGESVNYIAKKINSEIHAFDSFEGLPETWLSTHKKGHFALDNLPKFESNVVVQKGWFNESLPKFKTEYTDNVAFLHVDCDLYSSTKTIFDELGDRIVDGTIILFDEYFNYPFWEHHEYKAFDEFIKESGLSYEYLCYTTKTFGSKVAVRIIKS
tara:strand:- start:2528 stop:3130 length:603 start_codon:yes stop_codon:yes gene_type:complete